MNTESLTTLLIFLPMVMAVTAFAGNQLFMRSVIVGMSLVLTIASVSLFSRGPFALEPSAVLIDWHAALVWADFFLLAIILLIGIRYRHKLVGILVFLQLLPLVLLKFSGHEQVQAQASLAGDRLTLMLVLIVCVVGSLITLYACEYMRIHSQTHRAGFFRLGTFFFFMILFLGAMNGLLLSNNLLWMFFFWELTTLCSYVLIAYERTDRAISCALRALWMNLLGGVCFIWAVYLLHIKGLPLEISRLNELGPLPALMLPAALLCLAALTKSAQLPFQSWLTGAMVAPTPVSALLHSSTMVNAGVFLILKLTPVYAGTPVATYLTLLGALTFISTSVLALTQHNAKRILAYSTIGTLGLVIACAGMGTPQAYSAAMLLILFHALAKALLFMGVGHIDQMIRSKNIEDMWGLMDQFPRVSLLLIFGMVSMFLPPFGALVSKWMAVHAAADLPLIVVMLALASAVTVVYWTRWAGIIINSPFPRKVLKIRQTSMFIELPLIILALTGLGLSLCVALIYSGLAMPLASGVFNDAFPAQETSAFMEHIKGFAVYPVFLIIGFAVINRLFKKRRTGSGQPTRAYYSGLQYSPDQPNGFADPLGNFIPFASKNYYLKKYLSEDRINNWSGLAALGFILLLVATSL
ncbi:MAG: proton-conducting transporter membrane subunit [Desulfonatronovibrio sp.]